MQGSEGGKKQKEERKEERKDARDSTYSGCILEITVQYSTVLYLERSRDTTADTILVPDIIQRDHILCM